MNDDAAIKSTSILSKREGLICRFLGGGVSEKEQEDSPSCDKRDKRELPQKPGSKKAQVESDSRQLETHRISQWAAVRGDEGDDDHQPANKRE